MAGCLAAVVALVLLTACAGVGARGGAGSTPAISETDPLSPWEATVVGIRWVAYAPTNANPEAGLEPSPESVRADLVVLREAGFDGLVTYGARGALGTVVPDEALDLGFSGLIVGIWDPTSTEEIGAAVALAGNPLVLGYCVGNEGLDARYDLDTLEAAMVRVRDASGRPVATTEQVDDYADESLLALGDWVFPNAHPYFANHLDPESAVRWTVAAYEDTVRRSDRLVVFKEVGLPTAGDPGNVLSEDGQRSFYAQLAQTDVRFVYFEAFDQEWKTSPAVEPHWGLFRSDRSPKPIASELLGKRTPVIPAVSDGGLPSLTSIKRRSMKS